MIKPYFLGGLSGIMNGLLGSGGGMLAVPALKADGLDAKSAHRSSVAFILPLSTVSAGLYLIKGHVTLSDAWPFVPWGLAGAVVGTVLLKKMTPAALRKSFGALMVFAGVKIMLK